MEKIRCKADGMACWIKTPAAQPGHLSCIIRNPHYRTDSHKLSLTSTYAMWHTEQISVTKLKTKTEGKFKIDQMIS